MIFCMASVCLPFCLSGSQTFLVVRHSYVTHAFLGMLPLSFYFWSDKTFCLIVVEEIKKTDSCSLYCY